MSLENESNNNSNHEQLFCESILTQEVSISHVLRHEWSPEYSYYRHLGKEEGGLYSEKIHYEKKEKVNGREKAQSELTSVEADRKCSSSTRGGKCALMTLRRKYIQVIDHPFVIGYGIYLTHLDLGYNLICDIRPFALLDHLVCLDLTHNLILEGDLFELSIREIGLKCIHLENMSLTDNPVRGWKSYRNYVLNNIRSLKVFDQQVVRTDVIPFFALWKRFAVRKRILKRHLTKISCLCDIHLLIKSFAVWFQLYRKLTSRNKENCCHQEASLDDNCSKSELIGPLLDKLASKLHIAQPCKDLIINQPNKRTQNVNHTLSSELKQTECSRDNGPCIASRIPYKKTDDRKSKNKSSSKRTKKTSTISSENIQKLHYAFKLKQALDLKHADIARKCNSD
eukprot:Nk52_evm22s675 gene=Nk52_evmTU22s675